MIAGALDASLRNYDAEGPSKLGFIAVDPRQQTALRDIRPPVEPDRALAS
jgi:hypothetical protein